MKKVSVGIVFGHGYFYIHFQVMKVSSGQPVVAKGNSEIGGIKRRYSVKYDLTNLGGVMMKLSEKIVELRKSRGMTQEELAAICNVSRQSISKWEADIALPETEKLLLLGEVFHVSMDVLLKDELSLSEVKEVHACGDNAVVAKKTEVFEGTLIKESIEDDSVIDYMNVHKIELWNTGGKPKYWTALFFTSDRADFPEKMSKVMVADPNRGGNWFVDFKAGNVKYIVFRDKVLSYHIGNAEEKELVCEECRKLGITDGEMNWGE